jgi:hypothetical protein
MRYVKEGAKCFSGFHPAQRKPAPPQECVDARQRGAMGNALGSILRENLSIPSNGKLDPQRPGRGSAR